MRRLLYASLFFMLACQPTGNHLDPAKGSVDGNDQVSITGGPFGEGVQVKFGLKPAKPVTVISSEHLQVTVPPGDAAGFVDVVIIDSHGKQTTISKGFEYLPRKETPSGTGGNK